MKAFDRCLEIGILWFERIWVAIGIILFFGLLAVAISRAILTI